ncbi:septal ring lytic transglycosylase RlpA family protein [Bradyrhizobium sp. RT9a]|uniref:septal ring lytic transglycosylase RlpA family protein n=1 Tax=Bradyrhizobium sp. RT9a TaxID=3156384 RepID=UPI003398DA1E
MKAILVAALAYAAASPCFAETCIASWYGRESGPRTANGEHFKPDGISCAHRTRTFGSVVTVTHLASGRAIACRVNDRGPFVKGRCIDLSRGAAIELGIAGAGVAKVRVE